jgi:uncharacterized protein (DUF433 family)
MAFLDWSQCPVVESNPETMSGAWVFRGTRFPISTIFENLEHGATIDEILEWYQGLNREQIQEVVSFAARSAAPSPINAHSF